jgi:hypothetical protein
MTFYSSTLVGALEKFAHIIQHIQSASVPEHVQIQPQVTDACFMTLQGPSMISPRAYGASAVAGDALYTLGGMEYMNQSFQTSKMKVTPR